jgi:hypothetical protein
MGKQNKSDTEIFEFVQPELALSDLPAIETAKWGSKTSQIQKKLMLCNLKLHIPPIQAGIKEKLMSVMQTLNLCKVNLHTNKFLL